MWIIRVIHPFMLSRIIILITEKEVWVSAVYIMDRIKPEMICKVSVIPNRNPMFHIIEIDDGVGKSSSDFFIIFIIGLFFISWVFIRRMRIGSDWGGAFGLIWELWLELKRLP